MPELTVVIQGDTIDELAETLRDIAEQIQNGDYCDQILISPNIPIKETLKIH